MWQHTHARVVMGAALVLIGLAAWPSTQRYIDRADRPLLSERGSHAKRHYRPSGTAPPGPVATATCYDPSYATPWPQVNTDELCKCNHYDGETGAGQTGAYTALYGGLVLCWQKANPYIQGQAKIVPQNTSFSACISACTGSLDRARRAEEAGLVTREAPGDYWFCHAVNFIQDELCEFVGVIGGYDYTPHENAWVFPGLGSG